MTEFFTRFNHLCGESNADKQPHRHNNRCFPFTVLVHVNRGEYICYYDKKIITAKENETLVVPEYVLHDIEMKKSGNLSWAHITATVNDRDILVGSREAFILEKENHKDLKFFIESLNKPNDNCISVRVLNEQILISKIFILILQNYEKNAMNDVVWVNDIKRYITKNIDKKFTIKDLATQCCMSESSFCHKFKNEVGVSPIRYIILQKINESLFMLNNHLPIKIIAQNLNFSNEYYYSMKFKQITGLTPIEYIKNKNKL